MFFKLFFFSQKIYCFLLRVLQGYKYPKLRQLAKKILGIPATSAASERIFSLTGFIYDRRRDRLDPDTVSDMVVYYSYLRNRSE